MLVLRVLKSVTNNVYDAVGGFWIKRISSKVLEEESFYLLCNFEYSLLLNQELDYNGIFCAIHYVKVK